MSEPVDEARAQAGALLLANAGPLGLLASAEAYQQVWSRDTSISGLGLMLLGEPGVELLDRSMRTLGRHQSHLGNLPHNVGVPGVRDPALVAEGGALAADASGPASVVDTAHAGGVDGALWFIVTVYYRWRLDGDDDALAEHLPTIERAYRWLRYQDSNECGLLEVHESADWADLFANRYNSLAPNVLWYAVNRALASIVDAGLGCTHLETAATFAARADDIRFKINTLLWVGPESSRDLDWVRRHRREWLYPIQLTDQLLQARPFYLPYMAFRDWADRFDAFGNLLAVVFGVADELQSRRILDHIEATGLAEPWPICAVDPPVMPGERDWREYYRLRNLNLPHQYHNGGAWPFLGGFYVAALVRAGRTDTAKSTLGRLAAMNRQSRGDAPWGFVEWFHGVSGRPMGFERQSWSMALYVYAHDAVEQGRCAGFDGPEWAAPQAHS